MVSSYVIRTTIRITPAQGAAFNRWVASFEEKHGAVENFPGISEIPAYFDGSLRMCHNDGDGEKEFDWFLAQDPNEIGNHVWNHNNWRFDGSGLLVDHCEKFFGAVSMLHYFIDIYFRPRGISLKGVIVAANTDADKGYVYQVNNNVITLDVEYTRKLLRAYMDESVTDEEYDYTYLPDVVSFTEAQFHEYIRYLSDVSVAAPAPAPAPALEAAPESDRCKEIPEDIHTQTHEE